MVTKNTLSSAGRPSEDSILIWNPSYSEGESVEWFGGKEYSSSVGSFVAQGEGRANWYLNGVFEQSDEGNHFMGQRHGKIIRKFADGRTTVTYWNYGVKSNQDSIVLPGGGRREGMHSMVSSLLTTLFLGAPIIVIRLYLLWKHFLFIAILILCLYLLLKSRRRCVR